MPRFKDLTGQRFGRLTVIDRAENKGGRVCWNCHCDCGNTCTVKSHELTSGDTKSCGCIHKEQLIARNKIGTFSRKKVSFKSSTCKRKTRKSKIYQVWANIKYRCLNPNCKAFSHYGGRGIKIYSAWIDDFQEFYNYVSKLDHFGENGYSLDRIDNNGNYEPNNLRWTDQKTQLRNTRVNRIVEYQGESMTLAEAAEKFHIGYTTLQNRLARGDTGEKLFRPVK